MNGKKLFGVMSLDLWYLDKDGHSVSGLMVFSVLRPKRPDQKDRGLPRSYEFSYDHILNHDISSSSDRRETKHSLLDSP